MGTHNLGALKIDWTTQSVDGEEQHVLVLNGKVIRASEARFGALDDRECAVEIYDTNAAREIAQYRFREIAEHVDRLALHLDLTWDALMYVQVTFRDGYLPHAEGTVRFEFGDLRFKANEWAKPYSLAQFAEALSTAAREFKGTPRLEFYREAPNLEIGFGLQSRFDSSAVVIETVESLARTAKILSDEAVRTAVRKTREHSVVVFFEFPSPIRSACEQYLLYFVQFLEDMGIKSYPELKDEGGKILFSITPKDDNSALATIRSALDFYLQFPRMPEFDVVAAGFSDVAVVQLKANVLHLQSQLELARAVLQAKDATIQSLNLAMFQQQLLLSGSQAQKPEPIALLATEDSEPIIGDTVHVTPYKGKLLKVDLPTILRRLKRAFASGQRKR